MICFDENPQRQNGEEDRRGYGGRFEERGCGGEAWEELEREKAKERKGERTDLTQNFAEGDKGEAKERMSEGGKGTQKLADLDKGESDDEPELAATNTHECGYSSRRTITRWLTDVGSLSGKNRCCQTGRLLNTSLFEPLRHKLWRYNRHKSPVGWADYITNRREW